MKRTLWTVALVALLGSGCASTQYSKGYYAGAADTEIECGRAMEQTVKRARAEGWLLREKAAERRASTPAPDSATGSDASR